MTAGPLLLCCSVPGKWGIGDLKSKFDVCCSQDSLSFRQVAQRPIQIGPKVLDRLDPYFSGEDSLASNKAGAFLP